MSDFHVVEQGKRSPWERPLSQPGSPPASYQGNQQQVYQEPYYQQPQDQAKGYYVNQPQQQYVQGAQGYAQQQQQPQVVYVKDKRHKDHIALGFCAGCATGLCCCGCSVM